MRRAIGRIVLGSLSLIAAITTAWGAEVTFSGSNYEVVSIEPEKNTGLDKIFVVYTAEGLSMTFTDAEGSGAKWSRYSSLGGGYAEEISDVTYDGNTSTLSKVEGDMGYIIDYGDRRYYCWVTDYSNHYLKVNSLEPDPEQDCDATLLKLNSSGGPIHYFTINGQQRVLSRDIEIDYFNLEWNQANEIFDQIETTYTLESPSEVIRMIPAVLCPTTFTLRGDRFLRKWGMGITKESSLFKPHAVDVRTKAVQTNDSDWEDKGGSNQISGQESDLGGSAPAQIEFTAQITDAVIHSEWQMTTDPEFENIEYRFNQQDLDYTFTEEGVYYLRFIGSNEDGSCEAIGDTYTVAIGASELRCPNAFSPGASEGVNDVWKVAYRSILEFECWIFDRYGTQMYHFTDITDGWDGTYRGKLVKPGVYYYVIQATGSDGKKYKKSGDINIVRFREGESTSGSGTEE